MILFNSASLSDIIGSWSKHTVAQDWSYDAARLQSWVDEIQSTILHVRNIVLNAIMSHQDQPASVLTSTCLVIAVLGEYIGQTINEVCLHRGLDTPVRQNWWVLSADCSTILIDLMKSNGWCANQLAELQVSEMRSPGILWLYANMVPPQAQLDHSRCTPEECLLLQVDVRQYDILHRCETSDCSYEGPSSSGTGKCNDEGCGFPGHYNSFPGAW